MKKHILFVDDEENIREILREMLTLKGYRVSTAADPAEGKKIALADPPQLIIVDFQFEESDGLVLIDELKTILPETPIVLLTGAIIDRGVLNESILKKVACYLDKPGSLRTVVSEVQRLLGDS